MAYGMEAAAYRTGRADRKVPSVDLVWGNTMEGNLVAEVGRMEGSLAVACSTGRTVVAFGLVADKLDSWAGMRAYSEVCKLAGKCLVGSMEASAAHWVAQDRGQLSLVASGRLALGLAGKLANDDVHTPA